MQSVVFFSFSCCHPAKRESKANIPHRQPQENELSFITSEEKVNTIFQLSVAARKDFVLSVR